MPRGKGARFGKRPLPKMKLDSCGGAGINASATGVRYADQWWGKFMTGGVEGGGGGAAEEDVGAFDVARRISRARVTSGWPQRPIHRRRRGR